MVNHAHITEAHAKIIFISLCDVERKAKLEKSSAQNNVHFQIYVD